MEIITVYLTGMLWGIHEITHIRHFSTALEVWEAFDILKQKKKQIHVQPSIIYNSKKWNWSSLKKCHTTINNCVASQAPVTHTYNPSYLGSWDLNRGSRPAWANGSRDHISKMTRAKWTGGVAQAVECLLCKCKTLTSNPSHIPQKIMLQHKKLSQFIARFF
jgi:hypothetical protein